MLVTAQRRTAAQMNSTSNDDVRNKIIVEMFKSTADNGGYNQSKNDNDLVGITGCYLALQCFGMN